MLAQVVEGTGLKEVAVEMVKVTVEVVMVMVMVAGIQAPAGVIQEEEPEVVK